MIVTDRSKFLMLLILTLFILVFASFVKIHIRTQTTLIGYHLGYLKEKEADLLEKLSRKKSSLAALSTKSKLKEFARKGM